MLLCLWIDILAAVFFVFGLVKSHLLQPLWGNLIKYTLGAIALTTELSNNDSMVKPSVGWPNPYVTRVIAFLLMIQFRARSIFGVDEKVKKTLIFKLFICQFFNEFNARQLENTLKELFKNKLYLIIIRFTVVHQLVMMEFLKQFASIERLN